MRRLGVMVVAALLCVAAGVARSQAPAATAEHKAIAPDEIKWGDALPVFNKGAKMAVLAGDPSKTGMFIIRFKAPAGYKIAPHWHPTDENVTVISGSFAIGMGDKLDPKAKAYPPGSFFSMPAKMHHFAIAKKESEVEISGMGPFAINYLDPADDPSKKSATK
ncbi:MAG: Cupin region [bacterium]|nr:Cupin region [bacterium]